MKTVSVIIPVYNMEAYLRECLDSVIGQTLEDIEIICIDDGSTDGTISLLEDYQSRYDNMIVLHQNRAGAGRARNEGIKRSRGQFLAFMDADDYYPSGEVLETLYKGATANKVKAAAGRMLTLKENSVRRKGSVLLDKMHFEDNNIIDYNQYQFCYGYQGFIFDSETVKGNEFFFPDYIRGQDINFMLEAMIAIKKFWTTSLEVYVHRSTDKRINYDSARVMIDIAKSRRDILYLAKQNQYNCLQTYILDDLTNWKCYFFLHILGGNETLYDILQEMNDICDDANKEIDRYYLDYTKEQMEQEIIGYVNEMYLFLATVREVGCYIIYGAGRVGKSVYDVLIEKKNLSFEGFVVTARNPKGTARGVKVNCIEDYLDRKEEIAVVVSAEEPNNSKMMQHAQNLGFQNCISVTKDMIGVTDFQISDERFAV